MRKIDCLVPLIFIGIMFTWAVTFGTMLAKDAEKKEADFFKKESLIRDCVRDGHPEYECRGIGCGR